MGIFRQLILRVPAWFPLRLITATMLLGFVFTVLALLAFMSRLDLLREYRKLEDARAAQMELGPALSLLHKANSDLETRLVFEGSDDEPLRLPELITTLNAYAETSGLTNARFEPEARSVIGSESIRLQGQATGSVEEIRSFLSKLTHQRWVVVAEHWRLLATPAGTELTIVFRAKATTFEKRGKNVDVLAQLDRGGV